MKKKLLTLVLVLFVAFAANAQPFFSESFSSEIPTTWTVTTTSGDGWFWDDGTTYSYGQGCAIIDSDASGGLEDATLTSPTIDCSSYSTVVLKYNYNFQKYSTGEPDSGYVEVFDGTDWIWLKGYHADSPDAGPQPDSLNVTAYAAGNANFQVRFGYNADYMWYFEVSDVQLFNTGAFYNVTFNCNINDSITSGYFTAGTDTLIVTGSFAGWAEPGTNSNLFMTDDDSTGIYTYSVVLSPGDYEYKYFKNAGWSNGEWDGSPNRTFSVVDADVVLDDVFGNISASVGQISKDGIKVFPNPSNGVFNINVDSNYSLEIFDITGRVINTRTLTGNTSIELNTSGVYFLRFSNEEGSYTEKVIVQ